MWWTFGEQIPITSPDKSEKISSSDSSKLDILNIPEKQEIIKKCQQECWELLNEVWKNYAADFCNKLKKYWAESKSGAYCGFNVRSALETHTPIDLPDFGMHAYRYPAELDANPNFIKEAVSNPNEVQPWGLVVYDKWATAWSDAREKYGHIEVALWWGKYYFGKTNNYPGWSINANVDESWFTWYAYYPKDPNIV